MFKSFIPLLIVLFFINVNAQIESDAQQKGNEVITKARAVIYSKISPSNIKSLTLKTESTSVSDSNFIIQYKGKLNPSKRNSRKTSEENISLLLPGKLSIRYISKNSYLSKDSEVKIGKVINGDNILFKADTFQDGKLVDIDKSLSEASRKLPKSLANKVSQVGIRLWKLFDINSIFRLESPKPYTITTGLDNNNDSIVNDRPLGIRRNSLRGDWFKQFDINVSWKTRLNKKNKDPLSILRNQVTYTLTIQNLFNQTNKREFVGIQTSPFFGQATSSSLARTIQFNLNYIF